MKECCGPKIWIKFFKAVADRHRQRILSHISVHKSINAGDIEKKVGLSQPTISHHLKMLIDAGIIIGVRKGREIHYSLNQKNISSCCTGFMEKMLK
ncbi:hypothetical protein A2334_05345 [Candidatus Roizmanbacteria bacterium RIFOXYB2_FULL_38_10]|uniref:HTH arsR-type domain-containing protein n=1 Tax=Candidatus Roizmanbacteria bacterium RIFOXYD1_FULL_38_12 TaxID=1802093 RepID=A0A1F7L0I6_9BACT|nr:MAG: hypothetical protein A3K47_02465 [Candidatus Roizmanbacteria bacterium RIFOXYA2_FULL_38_14]OGK63635.1 MAG: hypothetical protein A3K27_02465 [Candidatus Roizmanbacteria bacterium RIFOXYA1_FULL_37_12]OGK65481.1 MAG: hypothetical protein A3K38_02465 [Candidatus Roizmanbacteria bacterium RIFOXYB1_FULL_40_23]OGK68266.1 MAG: hypothetical protein A2334_05345 [Candidatus Roizmanbacteria bacterium RIFOXYB2_FULL_38_10]OGK69886.1 MAG: hypothetical protein A3K21_02470 [Candidatus Roizmanbacteria ba